LVASPLVNATAAKLKLFHTNRKGFFRPSNFEIGESIRARLIWRVSLEDVALPLRLCAQTVRG
jgi:hypothetical protein